MTFPYPWQHPEYKDFATVTDRIRFCRERAEEATAAGSVQLAEAWTWEMVKYVPELVALLDTQQTRIAELETVLHNLVSEDHSVFYDAMGHCRWCGYKQHTGECPVAAVIHLSEEK